MIKFYVPMAQLVNFLELKEPVKLITIIYDESYVEFVFPLKDVIINNYMTHSTIRLKKTRKEKWKKLWQRNKKN